LDYEVSMPSILTDYRVYDSQTNSLLRLRASLKDLPPTHQKLVAEIVLLRLFSLFENLVSSVSIKLVCGASYVNGSSPVLLKRVRYAKDAIRLFVTHGRPRPRYQLIWTKAKDIKDNVKYAIDITDNYMTVVDRNATFIDKMRRIRNRIAHNNTASRNKYREVVKQQYGAYLNHVTPGTLLLTPRFIPCLLEQYIRESRILAKDLVRA